MIITKLYEFVSISKYKDWVKFTDKNFYDKMGEFFQKFPDHDKNYNRIYFNLKINPDIFQVVVPQELQDFMGWYGYPILNYDKGICRDKDGREIKIGKLLTKLGEERLLKTYVDSKQNTLKKTDDLQVVISRHPYDIIGMSTNRGWTTCHDINDKRYGGKHLGGLKSDLQRGILIAYLIKKSDRNITKPICRCKIVSYYNGSMPFDPCSKRQLYIDNHSYGTNVPEFREFLIKWVYEYNQSK